MTTARTLQAGAALAAIVALACAPHLRSLFFLLLLAIGNRERPFDQKAAGAVVANVLNGTLTPNANGVVKLPASSKDLALYGEVYVTKGPSGAVWVLFRTWQGKGDDLHGFLYHSTPAAGPVPATVGILGPTVGPTPTMKLDYFVDRQIDPNWYQVHFDSD